MIVYVVQQKVLSSRASEARRGIFAAGHAAQFLAPMAQATFSGIELPGSFDLAASCGFAQDDTMVGERNC
jgi:hypothetical protein